MKTTIEIADSLIVATVGQPHDPCLLGSLRYAFSIACARDDLTKSQHDF